MDLPDPDQPRQRYRFTLPPPLMAQVHAFRARHRDITELTAYPHQTVEFALQLLLALEPLIFLDEPVSHKVITTKIREYGK